jgi:2-succinyl-5-enolpyruvyl-6-hydroxy-3-cyclohexene-1-carboxylate synthase
MAVVPGKNVPVWANRGLSGIDGTIATARGFSLGRSHSGFSGLTRVVLGDLAMLHDAGSLLLQESERDNSRLHLFVVTDGGGSLFDSLEVAQSANKSAYDRVIFTPVEADLASLATAYGWAYRKADNLGGLIEALADTRGHLVVECPVDRAGP